VLTTSVCPQMTSGVVVSPKDDVELIRTVALVVFAGDGLGRAVTTA
jgi:hypothetical protein